MLATPSRSASEAVAAAQSTVQIGLLYAQSGHQVALERPLLQATLLAIDELNELGGVLGHRIEATLGDTASCTTGFLAQARSMLAHSNIATLFGGSSAEARKACLPLLKRHRALLWYPMGNDGLESSQHIFYGGACPNQELLPALRWLLQHLGDRVYLIGTEGSRNRNLQTLICCEMNTRGIATSPVSIPPTINPGQNQTSDAHSPAEAVANSPLETFSVAPHESDFSHCWKAIAANKPSVIISTLEGDSKLKFFRQYSVLRQYAALKQQSAFQQPTALRATVPHHQGQGETDITDTETLDLPPIFAFNLTASDLQQLGTAATGHYTAAGYFQSLPGPANQAFVERFRARYGADAMISDGAHTAYSQVYLWKQAVEAAQSFQPDRVRTVAYGQQFEAPGGPLRIGTNHYAHRPCRIARVTPNVTFELIHEWAPIAPLPWLGAENSPHGSLIAELLGQATYQIQRQKQLEQKQAEQQQLLTRLKAEVVQRHRSEQKVRLLLAIRQAVEQAKTARDALTGAIQCISQETHWPYGELWLPDENKLQRSTIWYLDEARLNQSEIQAFYQLRYDENVQNQQLRERFLEKVWYSEKPHWTRAIHGERVVGIPIFAPKATGGWNEILEDTSDESMTAFQILEQDTSQQVLGILLFALPQVRPQDKRLVAVVAEVAAQLGPIVQQKKAEAQLRQKNQDLAIALKQLQDTQAELSQSEKMAALGHFAAGIAHEINTPLGAIGASVDAVTQFIAEELEQVASGLLSRPPEQQEILGILIQRALEDSRQLSNREQRQYRRSILPSLTAANIPQPKRIAEMLVNLKAHDSIDRLLPLLQEPEINLFLEQLHRIVDLCQSTQDISVAVERASKVTIALKTYTQTGGSDQTLEATDIVGDIERVLDLYQNRLGRGIQIVRQFPVKVPQVLCYPEKLSQVWTHLIYNAIQAMEDARELTADTEQTLTLEIQCSHQGPHQGLPQQTLVVRVTDSGIGIPPAIQTEIFNPFFSTRPPGEGSGLGLNIARKIVKEHSGTITVESEPGSTTFTVTLPLDGCSAE